MTNPNEQVLILNEIARQSKRIADAMELMVAKLDAVEDRLGDIDETLMLMGDIIDR